MKKKKTLENYIILGVLFIGIVSFFTYVSKKDSAGSEKAVFEQAPIENKKDKYDICKAKTSLYTACPDNQSPTSSTTCMRAMRAYHICLKKY